MGTVEVKAGDVWESDAGRKAKVLKVVEPTQTIGAGFVGGWCGFELLATGAHKSASLKSFAKGRKLIERDGKPVEVK